jgi:hypothetical protein
MARRDPARRGQARQGEVIIRAPGKPPGAQTFGLAKMHRSDIAKLLPGVRGVLPFGDIAASNKMCATLCDVIETMLAVPPAPANETVVAPALTPQEFLLSALLDGPQPAKAVERAAQERHGWHPRVLFKTRQQMHVKAMRRGFGPGGCWIWALPEDATDRAIYFRPDEWRGLVAGRREWLTPAG